ncbi:putative Phosphatidylinositol N-acetylglucosaminyltransferase [groundwater metagenome]|uniref:Putative Phosphatidylinositol N-acetylglucosaminyltransferase n=1 Tax=groundwater metagenome TaxID=717931 RepID=A0A098EA19_9ZZZZ
MIVIGYPTSDNEPIVSGEIKNPFYLSQTLKKLGHDVSVINTTFTTDKKFDSSCRVLDGIKIYDVKKIKKKYLRGIINPIIESIYKAKKLLQLIKTKNFDIIHIHTSTCTSLAAVLFLKKIKIIKSPIIITFHGTGFLEGRAEEDNKFSFYNFLVSINNLCQLYIDRITLRWSEKIISAGEYQVKEMLDVYKVPIEKLIPISNGVDTSFYTPLPKDSAEVTKIRERYGLIGMRVVLLVGRIAKKKGFQYIVEAAPYILKQIPNTRFFIVGGIDLFAHYEPKLIEKIRYLNLEEKFIIVKDVIEKNMPLYYDLADVCVVPSINYEPLPTVIFEAMSCGKPVVASNIGGIPDQIGYKDTLVPQKNPNKMAKKVVTILTDKALANRLSNQNRIQSKKFEWEKIAKEHIIIYLGLTHLPSKKDSVI